MCILFSLRVFPNLSNPILPISRCTPGDGRQPNSKQSSSIGTLLRRVYSKKTIRAGESLANADVAQRHVGAYLIANDTPTELHCKLLLTSTPSPSLWTIHLRASTFCPYYIIVIPFPFLSVDFFWNVANLFFSSPFPLPSLPFLFPPRDPLWLPSLTHYLR